MKNSPPIRFNISVEKAVETLERDAVWCALAQIDLAEAETRRAAPKEAGA